jgi:hypothetical protein
LKSTWISARVVQFTYVALNSTLLSANSDEVLRNGTFNLSLENSLGHIPAVATTRKEASLVILLGTCGRFGIFV